MRHMTVSSILCDNSNGDGASANHLQSNLRHPAPKDFVGDSPAKAARRVLAYVNGTCKSSGFSPQTQVPQDAFDEPSFNDTIGAVGDAHVCHASTVAVRRRNYAMSTPSILVEGSGLGHGRPYYVVPVPSSETLLSPTLDQGARPSKE